MSHEQVALQNLRVQFLFNADVNVLLQIVWHEQFPLQNLRQTLDDLTRCGYSVVWFQLIAYLLDTLY